MSPTQKKVPNQQKQMVVETDIVTCTLSPTPIRTLPNQQSTCSFVNKVCSFHPQGTSYTFAQIQYCYKQRTTIYDISLL